MKENPERMFGRPEKIDTKPRQSYTDKRVTFMAEQGEGPKPSEVNTPQNNESSKISEWEKITGTSWDKTNVDIRRGWLESGQIPGPGATEKKPTDSEKEDAKKSWDKWVEEATKKGRYSEKLNYNKGIETLINKGQTPLTYEDPLVQQQADILNRDLIVHAKGKMKPEYFNDLIDRVSKFKDGKDVNTKEAENFITELVARRKEAERAPIKKKIPTKGGTTTPPPGSAPRDPEDAILGRIKEHFAKRPKDAAEEMALKEEINELIDRLPVMEAQNFPEVIQAASAFRETRERLISTTIFKAFEDTTETNGYGESIGFYEGANLATVLTNLSRQDHERYLQILGIQTAAKFFHTMNAKLIGGQLDEFMSVAENINYQHFNFMKDINGVSESMRLFEEKYNEYKARFTSITPEGYDNLKKEVAEDLRLMNEKGLLKSEFAGERRGERSEKLRDWELERAMNVARTFYNITFRGAEQIASGQLRESGGKRIASFPQESAARIMSWVELVMHRFEIAKPRGGLVFLGMIKKNYFEFMKDRKRKLGINKLVQFGGMNTEQLEIAGMFGVSGIYSTWRNETLMFPNIEFNLPGGRTTIEKWLRSPHSAGVSVKDAIDSARKVNPNNSVELVRKQDELLNILSPLIENNDLALGVLLKQGFLSEAVGYKARLRIWEKIAHDNLPLMYDYLTHTQFEGDAAPNISSLSMRRIIEEDMTKGGSWTTDSLKVFKNKLIVFQQLRVNRAVGKDVSKAGLDPFTPDESRLIEAIRNAGSHLAPHLADIAFPYVPFMNDVPFALLNYAGPGNEFYKRRTSDLVNFSKAEGPLVAIMNNPGGDPPEEQIKRFDTIIKGIESPQGTPDALERVFPMFKGWLDFVETTPGRRQVIYKSIRQSLRKPTSIAQEWAGHEAPSLDEPQVARMVDEAHRIGILSEELSKEMKKKKHAGLMGILWAIFRDYWYLPFVIGGKKFGSAVASGKAF